MTRFNQPISGNDLARFSGPNTFIRLPQASKLDGLDVAILGIPMDIGTSWQSGTRFGPKQIRAESAMIRPYNLQTGAAPFDALQVADIGDLAINTFSLAESLVIIRESYEAILTLPAIPSLWAEIIPSPCRFSAPWRKNMGPSLWSMWMPTMKCLANGRPMARSFVAPMKRG